MRQRSTSAFRLNVEFKPSGHIAKHVPESLRIKALYKGNTRQGKHDDREKGKQINHTIIAQQPCFFNIVRIPCIQHVSGVFRYMLNINQMRPCERDRKAKAANQDISCKSKGTHDFRFCARIYKSAKNHKKGGAIGQQHVFANTAKHVLQILLSILLLICCLGAPSLMVRFYALNPLFAAGQKQSYQINILKNVRICAVRGLKFLAIIFKTLLKDVDCEFGILPERGLFAKLLGLLIHPINKAAWFRIYFVIFSHDANSRVFTPVKQGASA